jgi:hypothetical protein
MAASFPNRINFMNTGVWFVQKITPNEVGGKPVLIQTKSITTPNAASLNFQPLAAWISARLAGATAFHPKAGGTALDRW